MLSVRFKNLYISLRTISERYKTACLFGEAVSKAVMIFFSPKMSWFFVCLKMLIILFINYSQINRVC